MARPSRIAVAYETGREGFWLARWLRERGVDAYVIHAASVAISREHRRAKTDRIDTAMLQRGFLGWLRGERGHCRMAVIPSIAEEDAKRPHRERESLVKERTRTINQMKAILTQFGVRNFKPALRKGLQPIASANWCSKGSSSLSSIIRRAFAISVAFSHSAEGPSGLQLLQGRKHVALALPMVS